jgi:hypothetical protein
MADIHGVAVQHYCSTNKQTKHKQGGTTMNIEEMEKTRIEEMEKTRTMKWRTPNADETKLLSVIVIRERHSNKTQTQRWDEYSLHEMEQMLVTAESLVGYALTKKRGSYYGSNSPSHYRIAQKKGIAYEPSRWNNPYRGIASTYEDNQFTITSCRYDDTNTIAVLKEYIENRKAKGESSVNKARLSRIEGVMSHSLDEWIKRRRLTEEKVSLEYICKKIHTEITNRSLGNSSSTAGPWSFDLGEYTLYLKRTQEPNGRGYTDEVTHLEPVVVIQGAGYHAHLLEQCWRACISHLNWKDSDEAKGFRDELGDYILDQLPKFQPHHDMLVRASGLWCKAWKEIVGFIDDNWGYEE